MALTTAEERLISLLPEWHLLLQGWAAEGRLTAAAQEALILDDEPQPLRDLVTQWSSGDFSGLPPIALLSASDISGAMGAYAISTGTIYLNADWLLTASQDQVNAVLTEELGHYLDGALNAVDTPGDEGEYFQKLINANELSGAEKSALRIQDDLGHASILGSPTPVEQAAADPFDLRDFNSKSTSNGFLYSIRQFGSLYDPANSRELVFFRSNSNGLISSTTLQGAATLGLDTGTDIGQQILLNDGSILVLWVDRSGKLSWSPKVFAQKYNQMGIATTPPTLLYSVGVFGDYWNFLLQATQGRSGGFTVTSINKSTGAYKITRFNEAIEAISNTEVG